MYHQADDTQLVCLHCVKPCDIWISTSSRSSIQYLNNTNRFDVSSKGPLNCRELAHADKELLLKMLMLLSATYRCLWGCCYDSWRPPRYWYIFNVRSSTHFIFHYMTYSCLCIVLTIFIITCFRLCGIVMTLLEISLVFDKLFSICCRYNSHNPISNLDPKNDHVSPPVVN
jgi:hypothetical protein